MTHPNSRSWARAAFIMLVLGQLVACQPESRQQLHGRLYFASGHYLAELDLRDASTSVVTSLGDVEIQAISPQRDTRLLLTVFGPVNQQDVHRLVLFDIVSRQTLTLLSGRAGHYLPDTRVLVYDDGVSIVVAERVKGTWEKTEVVRHSYNAPVVIAPLSATRFLYGIAGGPVNLFDTISKRSIELTALNEICRLETSLWNRRRDALLCRIERAADEFDYAFVALDGTVLETLSLPSSKSLTPVAFLPDQDALVLTERWSTALSDRVRHAIWVYRFDSREAYRLADNQHLGREVVYAPR